MGNSKNHLRKRKHPRRNQFSVQQKETVIQKDEIVPTDCSSIKIASAPVVNNDCSDNNSFNLIMDFSILQSIVSYFGCCGECESSTVNIENLEHLRMGFSLKLRLTCAVTNCNAIRLFYIQRM